MSGKQISIHRWLWSGEVAKVVNRHLLRLLGEFLCFCLFGLVCHEYVPRIYHKLLEICGMAMLSAPKRGGTSSFAADGKSFHSLTILLRALVAEVKSRSTRRRQRICLAQRALRGLRCAACGLRNFFEFTTQHGSGDFKQSPTLSTSLSFT